MPTPTELESAEQFCAREHVLVRVAGRGRIVDVDAIKARDAAIALAAKRELLEEIREAANVFLAGKGLTVSPCEAIAGAVQDAAIKYTTTEPAQEAPRRAKCHLPDCACGSCMGWAKEPHPSTCGCQTCWGVSDPAAELREAK